MTARSPPPRPRLQAWLWVGALAAMNAVTYMDRLSTAGMLLDVQRTFGIKDTESGFVVTVFVIFFTVFAPFCGHMADKYDRRHVIVLGMSAWSASIFASAFVPSTAFWAFLLLRGIGGVGEASFSVCMPTLVADTFEPGERSRIFMLILIAMPIGIGLGYVYGAELALLLGGWQRSFYVTPFLGLAIILMLMCVLREPRKHAIDFTAEKGSTSYWEALLELIHNKSFVWLTIANATMLLAAGGLCWFMPTAVVQATCMARNLSDASLLDDDEKTRITSIFGALSTVGGVGGILIGAWWALVWRRGACGFRATRKADAFVSALSAVGGVPFFAVAYFLMPSRSDLAWIFFSIGFLIMCLSWTIIVNFLMMIVRPSRRNVATSWFLLLAHLFGDASGPVVVGAISDALRGGALSPSAAFQALIIPFHALNGVLLLSGVMFLLAAFTAEYAEDVDVCSKGSIDSDAGRRPTLTRRVQPRETPMKVYHTNGIPIEDP